MKDLFKAMVLAIVVLCATPAVAVDIDDFVRNDKFVDIKLSPKGDYLAATVPFEDRTALVVIRRKDNQVTGQFALGQNTHVADFHWVNDDRVLMEIAEKMGALDKPRPTGELYAMNADGTKADILIGQRVRGSGAGTHIKGKKEEMVAAFLVDPLPGDDKAVVVAVWPFTNDPYTRAERLDVYTGRRTLLARAPVRNASFFTDHRGVVRFARGWGTDNMPHLYYRAGEGKEWELVVDDASSAPPAVPVGFSEDDRVAYLVARYERGPNALVSLDTASGHRRELLRDDDVDPSDIIYRNGTRVPVGVKFMDGLPRSQFIEPASPEARTHMSLQSTFAGHAVTVASQTTDGSLALVKVESDRNPGDFYLFDLAAKKGDLLLSRAEWFDPEQMAPMRPITVAARDGLKLHGYLTTPKGSTGRNMPLVVMPHGGPFKVQDTWRFDPSAQMLARAGYAVLQLNFRGSGGYGHGFESAGAKQWGGAMQDDLTDATLWAIREGVADAGRICLYGASYGAYASLMGVAKEPALYRCAVGYVGAYDLPMMHERGDIQERGSGESYLRDWVGEGDALVAVSPTRLADRIKVPVFLAAGGQDQRTPVAHTRMMERELRKAGVPVESLYYDSEGHGFYLEKNRREYNARLLAFLARHLGGNGGAEAAGKAASAP